MHELGIVFHALDRVERLAEENQLTKIGRVTLQVGSAIISASSLSYLGLGVPLPTPEWGALLSGAKEYIRDYAYLLTFPGLFIALTVLCLNMLGDGLRDALDPKLKN